MSNTAPNEMWLPHKQVAVRVLGREVYDRVHDGLRIRWGSNGPGEPVDGGGKSSRSR